MTRTRARLTGNGLLRECLLITTGILEINGSSIRSHGTGSLPVRGTWEAQRFRPARILARGWG